MIDINEMREAAIALHGLAHVDDVYTIYYDETNNIRRLHVRSDGLNVPEPDCFVLGGIAHKGPPRKLDIEGLRSQLRIQKSAKEIKLKHLGSGSFLDLLGSEKIGGFLDWLIQQRLFLHYQVLDVIYWSIVDIVDSIVTELGEPELMMIAPALKNDLYTVLRSDLDDTVDLFRRYTFPDVGTVNRQSFLNELGSRVHDRRELLPGFSLQMLDGLLLKAKGLGSLPYLEDETLNVLIDEFSTFYLNRICLFKNSRHILDDEGPIEERLSDAGLTDAGKPFENYQFADSKSEAGVQISDVVTGLLGKAFTFLNRTPLEELVTVRAGFTPLQSRSMGSLQTLMKVSISENAAFAQFIISHEDRYRADRFLGI